MKFWKVSSVSPNFFIPIERTNYNMKVECIDKCNSCFKNHFLFRQDGASLNQRYRIFTHCRHFSKNLLCHLPQKGKIEKVQWMKGKIYAYQKFIYSTIVISYHFGSRLTIVYLCVSCWLSFIVSDDVMIALAWKSL